jgi:hypothetical protein
MYHLETVVTETAKGHRVWIQGLDRYGWPVGTRYNVFYTDGEIVLHRVKDGKRAVSKGKGGIVDLVSKKVTKSMIGSKVAYVTILEHSDLMFIATAKGV